MSHGVLLDALALPPDARLDQRVPKKLLTEHGAPTAADRRLLQEGIDELLWVAALKPNTIGVPVYRDDTREYLEIAVLTLRLRGEKRLGRLVELVHRAIPYPVLLLTELGDTATLSLAHLRWSQGEAGTTVIEAVCRTEPFSPTAPAPVEDAFLRSLALAGLPRENLYALYQGWIDRATALDAARITGSFSLTGGAEEAEARRGALAEHERLRREISSLRKQAEREKQLNRRVALNLDIKQREAALVRLDPLLRQGVG